MHSISRIIWLFITTEAPRMSCSTLPTAPVLPSACPLRMTIMPSPRTQPSSAASAICPVPAINYCTPVTAISFSCRLQTATCIWQISCRNMRFIPGSAALTLCSYRSLWSCFTDSVPAVFVTRFVTKPLKLLMQSVQEIEIGIYENRLTESLLPTRSVS